MSTYDPPEPPDGDPACRLCDQPMQYDPWCDCYYCDNSLCPYPPEEAEAYNE